MFVHYRTNGFFLKKIARGENDQLFTIFTRDFGRLEILGRSIRKIKSKLRSGADLFYFSEIEFIQGKSYKTLTDAIVMERFDSTKKSLRKMAIANKTARLCCKLLKHNEPDDSIWQLVKETFYRINDNKENFSILLAYYFFCWNLISLLGYGPELQTCFCCYKKIKPERLYFSPSNGGIMCSSCYENNSSKVMSLKKDCRYIRSDIIKILRMVLLGDWQTVSKLNLVPAHQKHLKEASEYFVSSIPAYSD